MKYKIFTVILLISVLSCLCSCKKNALNNLPDIDNEIILSNQTSEESSSQTEEIQPTIICDDNCSAYVRDNYIYVTYDKNYIIKDVNIDGEKVWLINNRYKLNNYTEKTCIAISTELKSTSEKKQAVNSVILSFYNTSDNSYSITWHTDFNDSQILKIRKKDTNSDSIINVYSSPANDDFVNRAVIYDLDYNSTYIYTICDSSGENKFTSQFNTQQNPSLNSDVTFVHVSDTQDIDNNGTVWKFIMEQALTKTSNIDMILHTGDVVQNGGNETEWTDMIRNVQTYVSSIPLAISSGNHSYWKTYKKNNSNIIFNHLTTKLPESTFTNGIYYSYDYKNIHFVVLSTGDSSTKGIGKDQLAWLENDLKNTNQEWKIVMLHNPLYSPGEYGSSTDKNEVSVALRKTLEPILCNYKVDLVLQGHDHVFSISYPIDFNNGPVKSQINTITENKDNIQYFVNPNYPIYLLSAHAGNQTRSISTSAKSEYYLQSMPLQDNCAGYSIVTIKDKKLYSTFYEYDYINNKEIFSYSWGIDKSAE